jgi:Ca2+/Na+ antiporter
MSKANARYHRTILLGTLAMASLVWVAVDQFAIPWEDMAWLMVYTLVVVFGIIAFAGVAVGLWLVIRKLFGRD